MKVTFETSPLEPRVETTRCDCDECGGEDDWTWCNGFDGDESACHDGIDQFYKVSTDWHSIVLVFTTIPTEGAATCRASVLNFAGREAMGGRLAAKDYIKRSDADALTRRCYGIDSDDYVRFPSGDCIDPFLALPGDTILYWWVEYWGWEYA